jgi:hypothetical protein
MARKKETKQNQTKNFKFTARYVTDKVNCVRKFADVDSLLNFPDMYESFVNLMLNMYMLSDVCKKFTETRCVNTNFYSEYVRVLAEFNFVVPTSIRYNWMATLLHYGEMNGFGQTSMNPRGHITTIQVNKTCEYSYQISVCRVRNPKLKLKKADDVVWPDVDVLIVSQAGNCVEALYRVLPSVKRALGHGVALRVEQMAENARLASCPKV